MKCRVVYKPDKTIAVIHPAPKSRREDEAEQDWLDRVFTKAMTGDLTDLPYDDIDDSELPTREFRHQWRGEKGKGISLDKTIISEAEQREQAIDSATTVEELKNIIRGN